MDVSTICFCKNQQTMDHDVAALTQRVKELEDFTLNLESVFF